MKKLCGVRNFTQAAIGAVVFALSLSVFYFFCCVTVWALPARVAGDLISYVARQPISDTSVHTLAAGSVIELVNIVTAIVALDGIRRHRAGMLLVYVVYLPLYVLYEMVVLALMVIYLVNKSTYLVILYQQNPSTDDGRQHVLSYIYPFVPILCFWAIAIMFNIVGVVLSALFYTQMRTIQTQPNFSLITGKVYLGNLAAATNAKVNGFTHVLNCAGESDVATTDSDVTYKKISLPEGIGNLIGPDQIAEGVDWLRTVNCSSNKVLVSCHVGISRSASIVSAYVFAENPQLSYNDVIDYVMKRRYVIPHIGLEETLNAMYPRRPVA